MNNIGFISPAVTSLPYRLSAYEPELWDRQTVVLLCGDDIDINELRRHIRNIHKPNAVSNGSNYDIDIFVNLNYKMGEPDPANRSVRIIYCNTKSITMESINNRFPNSYIIKVDTMRGEEANGTSLFGRAISQIPSRERDA